MLAFQTVHVLMILNKLAHYKSCPVTLLLKEILMEVTFHEKTARRVIMKLIWNAGMKLLFIISLLVRWVMTRDYWSRFK